MKYGFAWVALFTILSFATSCKKEEKAINCFSDVPTVRVITNKKATVRLTASYVEPVYLIEEGTIDTRLIPCNFPMEFYQSNLQVTISGEVKETRQTGSVPCCAENFVITKIAR